MSNFPTYPVQRWSLQSTLLFLNPTLSFELEVGMLASRGCMRPSERTRWLGVRGLVP